MVTEHCIDHFYDALTSFFEARNGQSLFNIMVWKIVFKISVFFYFFFLQKTENTGLE